jgi:thymidylate kinase
MAWILVEGLDRSGKSSLAEDYRKKGYQIVHMEAPNKKYFSDNYSGESYLEELVRMYTKYDGQNVLFDRTIYGELVWPNIFGRVALLEAEDIDYLSSMERNNNVEKILMFDANTEAHWQRCVDNNEPLNRQQFGRASIFYDRLAREFGFKKKQLSDFPGLLPQNQQAEVKVEKSDSPTPNKSVSGNDGNTSGVGVSDRNTGLGVGSTSSNNEKQQTLDSLDVRLELANTIKDVLQSKILRKKGGLYDDLEKDIKVFLEGKLQECFTGKQTKAFSDDEIMILKIYASRIKEKSNGSVSR